MVGDHLFPLQRVAVLIGDTLAVDAIVENHRTTNVFVDGLVDVGTQHQAIVHGNRLVPGNTHAVADFAANVRVFAGSHVRFLCQLVNARAWITFVPVRDRASIPVFCRNCLMGIGSRLQSRFRWFIAILGQSPFRRTHHDYR